MRRYFLSADSLFSSFCLLISAFIVRSSLLCLLARMIQYFSFVASLLISISHSGCSLLSRCSRILCFLSASGVGFLVSSFALLPIFLSLASLTLIQQIALLLTACCMVAFGPCDLFLVFLVLSSLMSSSIASYHILNMPSMSLLFLLF